MRAFITICITVVLWMICAPAKAQATSVESEPANRQLKPLSLYVADTWNTRDGLPHNSVNRIVQSQNGYLWFATWEGPVRFNGNQFYLYEGIATETLPDPGLWVIHEGPDGTLYAGGRGFVAYYEDRSWRTFDPVNLFVYDIKTDMAGTLWIATAESGITVQRSDQSRVFIDTDEGLPSNNVYRLHVQSETGRVWALTNSGVVRIDTETYQVNEVSGLPAEQFRMLLEHSNGTLYIAGDSGLYKKLADQQEFEPAGYDISGNISVLAEGPQGDLWFGTYADGIGRVHNGRVDMFSVNDGLPNPHVLDIYVDHEQSIWASTHGGLVQLRDAVFSNFTTIQGLPGNYIRALMETSDGDIWVGSSQGPAVVRGNETLNPTVNTPAEAQSVLALVEHSSGDIFMGSYTGGLFRFRDGQVVSVLDVEGGLHANEIRTVIEESATRIWVGTANGLYLVDISDDEMRIQQRFGTEQGFRSNFITALFKDRQGTVWVGSTNGAGRMHPTTDGEYEAEVIPLYEVVGINNFYAIEETEDYMWFPASEGLIMFDKRSQEWELLTVEDGLPFPKYFNIALSTELGEVWLGASRGILRMRIRDVTSYLQSREGQLDFELFTEADGILSAQVNTGGPSALITGDNRYAWFATAEGAVRVGLNELEHVERIQPSLLLERVVVDGTEVQPGQRMSPAQDRVQFHYTSLGFRASDRIEFQVKLQGFDEYWQFRGSETSIEYTRLPAGDYEFKVQARYPGGPWSDSESIVFSKAPYIWERHGFWILVIVLAMVAVNLMMRIRETNLRKREKHLKEEVATKTAELEKLAKRDALTDLYNRRAFDEILRREFRKAVHQNTPVCLAILDIDHFKNINDTYLHSTGDRVLGHLAAVLKESVRKSDKVARWGGEEFVLFFPHTTLDEAEELCERIRKQVENARFDNVDPNLRLTVSIGVAQAVDVDTHSTLLIKADKALYQAKDLGRNKVCVNKG